jgi:hypothetical protein
MTGPPQDGSQQCNGGSPDPPSPWSVPGTESRSADLRCSRRVPASRNRETGSVSEHSETGSLARRPAVFEFFRKRPGLLAARAGFELFRNPDQAYLPVPFSECSENVPACLRRVPFSQRFENGLAPIGGRPIRESSIGLGQPRDSTVPRSMGGPTVFRALVR